MIKLKMINNITYIRYTSQSKSQKKLQLRLIQGDRLVDIHKALQQMSIKGQTDVYFNNKYLGVWRG